MIDEEKKKENGLDKKIKELEELKNKAKDKKTKEFYEYAIRRYKELNNGY